MAAYLLGLDNGGTMSKAALYDLEGREIGVEGCKTRMFQPEPGFTERDSEEMWAANEESIRRLLQKTGVKGEDIAGIAVTGHGNGVYLMGYDGKPSYNGIISTDSRGRETAVKWKQDGTFQKILPRTMQSCWEGQPSTILNWFLTHHPEVIDNTQYVFSCKDYIRYMLTGEAYGEITDMSGSSLMNVRDVCYDKELLEDMNLGMIYDKLPPLKYPGELCGVVSEEAAAATGLKAGTPVAGGCMDIHASAIATGITSPDKMCVVAGTWSINEYISKTPVVDEELFMTSIDNIPGYWMILEGSPTSASNLEWFLTEVLRDVDLHGRDIYECSNDWVDGIGEQDCGLVFLPFLFGSNANVNARGAFVGLQSWHNRENMLRAVYEGIVFSHRTHIEKLLKYRDKPTAIRLAGGAAKSRVWVQMFADVLQTPVEVARSSELGALGSAICAGVATGHFDSFEHASNNMVDVLYTAVPDPEKAEAYNKKYARYRKVIDALDGIWDDYME